MKKILFLVLILIFFICIQKVSAEPILTNVSLQPENVWFGEDVSISLNCYDSVNTITKVYGKMISPILSENLIFNFEGNDRYTLKLTSLYFDPSKPPKYTFSIYCENNNNQTSNTLVNFNVSQLVVTVSSVTNPAYIGDIAKLVISIEKDGSSLYTEGINFNLKLGGQSWSKTSFYDPGTDSWMIKFNVPSVLGTYDVDLEINANLEKYNPKKITLKSSMEVKDTVEFKILSIDKTEVRPKDVITVSISASERGNNIILSKNYLTFQIGSKVIDSDKVSITSAGNYFNTKIEMPDLSPGSYDLKIILNYANNSITQKKSVDYVVPISGKFVDLSNNGVNVEIKFLIDDVEKKSLTTDSSGSYTGYIVPGTYTIQLKFPQSTLYLYNIKISDFNDPVKYYFLETDVTGIKSVGLFIYEVALSHSKAKVVINYDEKKIPTEKNLAVYKCSEWNSESKTCNTDWEEQSATIDTIRNTVTIETSSLSAYTVGIKKSLYLDFSSEKKIFSIKELIKLRGVARDESGGFVQDVLLNVDDNGFNINASAYSGSNGVFVLEFFAPEEEGSYTLSVEAEKIPYLSYSKNWDFQVIKNREISLVTPDTIRAKKGESQTLQFSVVNIGQADISDLSLSLTGLPENYFSLQNKINELKIGQEVKIPVNFKIPQDASESTLSITFKVNSSGVSKEEIIGFTIFSENVTAPSTNQKTFPTFRFPTAQIALPVSSSDISYAFIFCVMIVSIAYFLKKSKNWRTKERKNVKNVLSDIKGEIRRKKTVNLTQNFNQTVENMEEKTRNKNNGK